MDKFKTAYYQSSIDWCDTLNDQVVLKEKLFNEYWDKKTDRERLDEWEREASDFAIVSSLRDTLEYFKRTVKELLEEKGHGIKTAGPSSLEAYPFRNDSSPKSKPAHGDKI